MKRSALLMILLAAAASAAARPPNIVLVMPDDVGYGDYSFVGNPVIQTPAIDGFSQQSVRFTDVQVAPTCSPTRSSIMTGRHEFRNGVTHTIHERERLTLRATTLAQVLKSAGYTTGIFGKWHLGDEEAYRPENRGFDEVYIHGAGGIGQSYPGSCGDAPGNSNINPALWHNGSFVRTEGYCTDLFFSRAMEWMDEQRGGAKPFFAMITPNAPHTPHVVPEDYYRHLLPKLADHGKKALGFARFLGMIENIDGNFGKLLGRIDAMGIRDNTLVIYMGSDNGGTAGAPLFDAGLRGAKGSPWQGGTRTWACWRWPAGFAAPADCGALTSRVDIFPTLAEIAGAVLSDDVRTQVEGRSLLPLLRDPKAAWPDRTLVSHVGRWEPGASPQTLKYERCAIRNARFTLVNNQQLFDLSSDPGEKTNVIEQHPEIVAQLRAEYEAWWESVQPQLVNEDAYRTAPAVNTFKTLYERQFGTDRP